MTSPALNNATFNMGLAAIGGGDVWKAGVAGLGTGGFNAAGGLGLVKQGFFGRLGFQGLSTSSRSFGQTWVYGRGIFSRVTVGVGPVNLTFGEGQFPVQWQENLGNIAFNAVGLANVVTGGSVYFNREHLALGYSSGLLEKIYGTNAWTGAYAILGGTEPTLGYMTHELTHIWQSRAFLDSFVPHWILGGLQSVVSGNSFAGSHGINFIEQQAYNNEWYNYCRF